MNMPISVRTKPNVLHQSVVVQFDYAVHFTEGLFDLPNPLFFEVLSDDRSLEVANLVVVIDGGLVQYQPNLIEQVITYCDRYSDKLNLKSTPLVIAGGEAVKNDMSLVVQIQKLISDRGLCRHSYVVAIGGGAVLDLVGYAAATAQIQHCTATDRHHIRMSTKTPIAD